jgi:4'-phosphopantetheinyl transferase EntD
MGAEIAFRLNLVHGRCVGVRIPAEVDETILAGLLPEERGFVSTLAPARHPSWVAGRLALREAFCDLGIEPGPILATRRGAPALPSDLAGSISHKRTLAVGLAARRENVTSIGVDLETCPPVFASVEAARAQARPDLRTRVLTQDELARLESVPEKDHRRVVTLHFSLKEALYKAIDPVVGRHVGFHEASLTPLPDGSVAIALALARDDGAFSAAGFWTEIENHFLTTARVQRT